MAIKMPDAESFLDNMLILLKGDDESSHEDDKVRTKLSTNTKRYHERNVDDRKCRICLRLFSSSTNLKRHLALHRVCSKKQFTSKNNKSESKRIDLESTNSLVLTTFSLLRSGHTIDLKPKARFSCSHCGSLFNHRILFEIHPCTIISNQNSRRFTCHCGKAYSTQESFEFHSFFHEAVTEFVIFS